MLAIVNNALADLRSGLAMRRVWIALASEDIGDQHRRTALGPVWLLINYLAFAGTFIFVFDRHSSDPTYAVYVATGLIVWFYIMETITQSVTLFVREEAYIKGTRLPLTVYVLRLALQSAIRAAYAIPGCLAILLVSGVYPTAAWAWAGLGVLIILALTPAVIVCFAFMGAFFPDSQFIIGNLMRLGMFVTPVFWIHGGEGGVREAFYYWNPFTYFLEVVRQPIVSDTVPVLSLAFCTALGLALWAVALLLLGRYRKRVAFVL